MLVCVCVTDDISIDPTDSAPGRSLTHSIYRAEIDVMPLKVSPDRAQKLHERGDTRKPRPPVQISTALALAGAAVDIGGRTEICAFANERNLCSPPQHAHTRITANTATWDAALRKVCICTHGRGMAINFAQTANNDGGQIRA